MKGYLVIPGNVNVFCPHCGKVLWEELPYKKQCTGCLGKITGEPSRRKTVTLEYVEKMERQGKLK